MAEFSNDFYKALLNLKIATLREKAAALPAGPEQVDLYQQGIQWADEAGDRKLGYDLRMLLVPAAMQAGQIQLGIVNFTWCRTEYDLDPNRFNAMCHLMAYRMVIHAASEIPEIAMSQLDELLDELEQRSREFGSTLHALCQLRRLVTQLTGRMELAGQWHARLLTCEHDQLSDCGQCVDAGSIAYFADAGRWADGGRAIDQLLVAQSQELCTSARDWGSAAALLPLAMLGRWEAAREIHRNTYRHVREGLSQAVHRMLHLQFAILAGDRRGAKRMIERHAADIFSPEGTRSKLDRYECLRVGYLYAYQRLTSGANTIGLRLPATVKLPGTKKSHDVAELTEYLRHEAEAVADVFDARHGNDFYRRRLAEVPGLLEKTASYRDQKNSLGKEPMREAD